MSLDTPLFTCIFLAYALKNTHSSTHGLLISALCRLFFSSFLTAIQSEEQYAHLFLSTAPRTCTPHNREKREKPQGGLERSQESQQRLRRKRLPPNTRQHFFLSDLLDLLCLSVSCCDDVCVLVAVDRMFRTSTPTQRTVSET